MDKMLRISSSAISDRGLSDKRPENEDAYLELRDRGIYAVADGVGGAQAGDVASQMAVEIIGEAFSNLRPGADPETVMLVAIEKANSSIYQMAQDLPQLASMATTIVALYLNDNIATVGHVGDSRLYRVDREGTFYRDTDDHSMVAEEVRAGRMTEEQAENHPSRNIISRALGAEETVSVDMKTVMIDGGTAFLLCSDGITRHVTDQEIKGVLTFGGSPADICEYLKDLCFHRGAEDNLTAVVVKTASIDAVESDRLDTIPNHIQASARLELEETTVSTARPHATDPEYFQPDEIDLLELDTENPDSPRGPDDGASPEPDPEPESLYQNEQISLEASTAELTPDFRIEPPSPKSAEYNVDEEFSIFGSDTPENGSKRRLSGSHIGTAAVCLLLGALIGIGAYYFAAAPRPVDTEGPKLTEMRAANIPLSAFEENRRNVDKDPAGYIARFGRDPQDCEDYYLLGRAFLLVGDYASAKNALTESRSRLPEADPTNAGVLASDIAIALSVTNGTTVQSMLRKELGTAPQAANQAVANSNSNR